MVANEVQTGAINYYAPTVSLFLCSSGAHVNV